MTARAAAPERRLSDLLREVTQDVLGRPLDYSEADLATILSPAHFVAVRRTRGGPAPSETARALGVSHKALEHDEAWLASIRQALAAAESRLTARSQAL